MAAVKATARRRGVSFTEQLARMTWHQACQLLGEEGEALIRSGSQRWALDPEADAYLGGDQSIIWPAAAASLACLLLNAGLLRYLYHLDRARR